MSTLLPPPASPLRRAAGAVLRSPVGSVLESLTAPHGVDRYLELLDPMLARDTGRAVVTDVRRETADTTTLTLRPNRWAGHRAGQHVEVAVEVGGRRRTRCYSVSSSEHRDDGQLTITVKADPDGTVSPCLAHHVEVGAVVGLSAASGDFVLPDRRPERLLLVSGGSGITPVVSMLRTLADEGADTEVTFLHYARTRADVAFADELRELHQRRPQVRVVYVLTRDRAARHASLPAHGTTTAPALTGHLSPDHVAAVGGDRGDVPAYVCGPRSLLDAATALWAEAGRADLLHVERFQPAAPTPVDGDATGTITLTRSGRTLRNDGRPLLDQAEAAGLSPASGCRMGICHTCIEPKLAGRVRDVRDGRLSTCDPEDVQLCISAPVGDVELDL